MIELENENLFDKYNCLSVPIYQFYRVIYRNTKKLFEANLTEAAKKKALKAGDIIMMIDVNHIKEECAKELKELCASYNYKIVL